MSEALLNSDKKRKPCLQDVCKFKQQWSLGTTSSILWWLNRRMLLHDQRKPVSWFHWMIALITLQSFSLMMQKLYLKKGLGAYGEVTLCLMICWVWETRPSVSLRPTFLRRCANSKTTSVLMFSPKLYILVTALFIIAHFQNNRILLLICKGYLKIKCNYFNRT